MHAWYALCGGCFEAAQAIRGGNGGGIWEEAWFVLSGVYPSLCICVWSYCAWIARLRLERYPICIESYTGVG